jgi:hypothetical protein
MAIGVILVALGQVATLGANAFAVREVLLCVRGETCPMGEFGAWMYGMMAVFCFDLPAVLATTMLVWLARRHLPRRVRISLLAGLAFAIVAPLMGLVAFR